MLSQPEWLVTYLNKVPSPGVDPIRKRYPIPVLTGLSVCANLVDRDQRVTTMPNRRIIITIIKTTSEFRNVSVT